ncbi:MAG: hypothetical protein J6U10_01390, partial [Lachnospiraceae bacterium]|nr:hypothetical protein [Lachnospiraceae bacterium]
WSNFQIVAKMWNGTDKDGKRLIARNCDFNAAREFRRILRPSLSNDEKDRLVSMLGQEMNTRT